MKIMKKTSLKLETILLSKSNYLGSNIKMMYKNEWYPFFLVFIIPNVLDGPKSCLVVDNQGHKLLPWTGTFTGSKLLFSEF